ncbi:uroporphyrinogen-III synthase, partial [Leucobacter sp. M11]|uniref:uroporphyrinogen-III synthase n=1 Tax=Leucobacter sp. M11 TaxID=2993565 RepID=UPI002D8089B3
AEHITEIFPLAETPTAPAQGALALEIRSATAERPHSAELLAALRAVEDPAAHLTAVAERAVLAELGAGCAAPVGASASFDGASLTLRATITAIDGRESLTREGSCVPEAHAEGALRDAEQLGRALARELVAAGADDIATLHDSCGHEVLTPHELTAPRILDAPRGAVPGRPEILFPTGGSLGESGGAELTRRGAVPVPSELIRTEALAGPGERARVAAALAELAAGEYAWLTVTSVTTVRLLAERGAAVGERTRIAAVGPATERALLDAGYRVDLVPGREHSAAGMVTALAAEPRSGDTVLALGADGATPTLAEGLRGLGFAVSEVPLYRTREVPPAPELVTRLRAGDLRGVLVTSGSVARALGGVFDAEHPQPAECLVIAIGAPSAEVAREHGLRVDGIAGSASLPAMLAAWAEAHAERGGTDVSPIPAGHAVSAAPTQNRKHS